MAADLFDAYPAARALIEKANEVLGFDLSSIMFGPDDPSDSGAMAAAEEKLRRTDLTQPALYVHSLAADAVLREMGIRPDCAAGHSLGEYSALASAGALTFEDGLRIVRRRGELMAAAHEQQPGTMAAIIGLDDVVVVRVCQEIEDGGEGRVVRPANFNSPGQIVISGDENSVRLASAGAEQAGAKKVMPLSVGGAFHSPLMAFSRMAWLAIAAESLSTSVLRFSADFHQDRRRLRAAVRRKASRFPSPRQRSSRDGERVKHSARTWLAISTAFSCERPSATSHFERRKRSSGRR